jgi:hypothetical protein
VPAGLFLGVSGSVPAGAYRSVKVPGMAAARQRTYEAGGDGAQMLTEGSTIGLPFTVS